MYKSRSTPLVRFMRLVIGLLMGCVVSVQAQQSTAPVSATAVKSTPARQQVSPQRARKPQRPRSNYHRIQKFTPHSPGYTKAGRLRQLSPDQLWDARPDSTRPNRGPFRLLVYAGLGASYYSSILNSPVDLADKKQLRWAVPASLRVMWQTDHLLRLGLETGYVTMYSYQGNRDDQLAKVRVTATPILAVFSMSVVKRFALYAGTGVYRINSNLSYDGATRGTTYSLGWMAAGTYTQPISKNVGLAAELKWFDATQTKDACFIAQATLVWRALTW